MRRPRELLLLVLTLLIPLRGAAQELPLDVIENDEWRQSFRIIGIDVLAGRPVRALADATGLGWEIFHRGRDRHFRELAFALLFQSLAQAQMGRRREAQWHWAAAVTVWAEMSRDVVRTFPQLGPVFDSSPQREQAAAVERLEEAGQLLPFDGTVERAQVLTRQPIPTPDRRPGAFKDQRISVSYLIDPEGRPHFPVVGAGQLHSLAVYSILQSLVRWQHEPARRQGRAGWCRVERTFSFKAKGR